MSTLETKKIEPLSGTSVTLGASGDAVTLPAGVTLKTNTVKDAGGNTLWTSDGSGTLSSLNAGLAGNMIFISSQTVSAAVANINFTSGINSTYDEYMFIFTNISPSSNNVNFTFNASTDGGSNYNVTKTSTAFRAYHLESDSSALLYQTGWDLAQSASDQQLMNELGDDADMSGSGILHLFAPASTTYVKHFYSRSAEYYGGNGAFDVFIGGYLNTTSAINALTFKISSGNIDAGTIALYGIK